jgi:hypothetical protein
LGLLKNECSRFYVETRGTLLKQYHMAKHSKLKLALMTRKLKQLPEMPKQELGKRLPRLSPPRVKG